MQCDEPYFGSMIFYSPYIFQRDPVRCERLDDKMVLRDSPVIDRIEAEILHFVFFTDHTVEHWVFRVVLVS